MPITALVAQFHDHLPALRGRAYNETELRVHFLNPLFEALGWDVTNRLGRAEVKHEDRVLIANKAKAPDYGFYLDGRLRFYVEAKKPAVNLDRDANPALQLRRYAWTAKLPLSILTDFEELAVYDSRVPPRAGDGPAVARLRYWKYTDYPAVWDELAALFGRDAVLAGSLEQFAAAEGGKKGIATVDAAFLAQLNAWRDLLARAIANRNPRLSQRDLNFAVQQTLDRLIFLRIAEDRGSEPYGQLRDLTQGPGTYDRLLRLFYAADGRYNSGLFHLQQRGRHDQPDLVTPALTLDDKPLKEIIRALYEPISPYEFSVFPADILGQVYEQFLGQVIRLTPGGRAVVEDKPEVRKAGGVYYTPTYIVDYIVRQTVGRLLDEGQYSVGQSPISRSPNLPISLRVLDPACGSGSFLLGAYQYLLDWHLAEYLKDTKRWSRKRGGTLHQAADGTLSLTLAERKRILVDHLFGVDIDPQAVEVTKLSLLLKLMEGAAAQIGPQQALLGERLLPDLDANIQCGNSLIGPDFYARPQPSLLGDDELLRVNPFDWHAAFPEIMSNGGFDVVIGNPPYGAMLSEGDRRYLADHFRIGSTDTAALMMVQAQSLAKQGGILSFIVPKPFTYASNWEGTRAALLPEISEVVDVGKVWRAVKLEQVIFQAAIGSNQPEYRTAVRNGQTITPLGSIQKSDSRDFGFILNGISHEELEIGRRIRDNSISLASIVTNTRGGMFQKQVLSDGIGKMVLGGAHVQRYHIAGQKGVVTELADLPPNAFVHPNSVLVQNIVAHIENPLPHIKIIGTVLTDEQRARSVILDTVNQLTIKDDTYSAKFLLGVLHSKLINWYVYRFIFGKAIRTMHFDGPVTFRVPIPNLADSKSRVIKLNAIDELVNQGIELYEKSSAEPNPQVRTSMRRHLGFVERQIDDLVYKMYGLTAEDIDVIEINMP